MNRASKFLFVLLVAAPVFAQQPAPQGQAPAVAAGASVTTVAIVEAINQETREVSLRKEDGELVQMVIGPEARNLAQVKKGDRVTVTYEVGLVVALGPPGQTPARVKHRDRAHAGGCPARRRHPRNHCSDGYRRRDRCGCACRHVARSATDRRARGCAGHRPEQGQGRRPSRRRVRRVVCVERHSGSVSAAGPSWPRRRGHAAHSRRDAAS